MIVACPSCGARFNLDSAKLLPAGRNVRCAKCDHRWKQMPEGFEEAAPAESPAPPEPAPEAFAPPPPEPVAEPEPEPAPEPAAASFAPPPEETESHPPTPPETPAEMAQSLAAIAEQVAGARGESYTVKEGAPQNPIARMARRTAGPGPITVPPRMRPMRPAKRSANFGLMILAGCIIGLLAVGWIFADLIARTVPGADVIYSLLGLSTENPAADLEISVDDFDLSTDEKTGQKVFDLKATVFNKSDYPVNMPALTVIPVDDAGGQMEPLRFRLRELVVEPGQNIKFKKSFDNWPPTAPNFELKVADAP